MWPFKKRLQLKRFNVRKADIRVELNDGRWFRLEFVGQCLGPDSFDYAGEHVMSAIVYVETWQDQNGKRGTVALGEGHYVPLCNVKDIKVSYADHYQEVLR